MSAPLPEPLVPQEVDLRDFVFMPLDVLRLRDSDLSAVATGEQFKAAVLLWCAAWHQVPAASVPNDDRWLARHSGAGPTWRKVKLEALRGFVECSDGRLYHEIVAEKALESWAHKLAQRERTRLATEARRKRDGGDQDRNEQRNDNRDVQRNVDRNVHQGTGQGQGQGTEQTETRPEREGTGSKTPEQGQHPPPGAARAVAKRRSNGQDQSPKTALIWEAYSEAYAIRWKAEPVRNATVNAQLAQVVKRLGSAEAPAVSAFYVRSNRGLYVSAKHPVNLLLRDCEALRTEWATGHQGTDTEARQADRTAATAGAFAKLIEEAG